MNIIRKNNTINYSLNLKNKYLLNSQKKFLIQTYWPRSLAVNIPFCCDLIDQGELLILHSNSNSNYSHLSVKSKEEISRFILSITMISLKEFKEKCELCKEKNI